MAYATSNPPALYAQGIFKYKFWKYESADAATAVRVAGYFTNGWDLGMRVGDIVFVTAGAATTIHTVNAASATGGVDLTDGLAVGTTDTD